MKRLNLILAAVFAAQLLLTGALLWTTGPMAVVESGQALVSFERDNVERIVIDTAEQGSVTLRKSGQRWTVPSREGFPADRSKVDGFLSALSDLKPRLPVAVTEDAGRRFHVGAKDFERRITLKQGEDTLTTLYLGDSAGPDQVFARAAGGEAIFEIALGLWQASGEPSDWLDRSQLRQKRADIVRIDLPSFTLQRTDDTWQLSGPNGGNGTDAEKAARVVDRLTTLTFEDVRGKKEKSPSEAVSELSYTLTLKNGERVRYSFSKADQGDDYLLRTSTSDYVFSVSKEVVDEIHDLKPDALAKETEKARRERAATGAVKRGSDNTDSRS